MKIDKQLAEEILREEAALADQCSDSCRWVKRFQEFSELCEEGGATTHVAFLGTSLLAKAVDSSVDLFAIKPNHAEGNERAYSARILCHHVLVPVSAELLFSIGVTGREPLNNQPYFRMTRFNDGTPVHASSRPAFDFLVQIIEELSDLECAGDIRRALRAYVYVRKAYLPKYRSFDSERHVSERSLVAAAAAFTRDSAEGGKRAQALVAGLMDAFAGREQVYSGRINDPDRGTPGDVCVSSVDDRSEIQKAIEVRDKIVTEADIQIFGRKCVENGVRDVCVVMVNEAQGELDQESLTAWAEELGIGVTLFFGWRELIEQALFWTGAPKPIASQIAAYAMYERLRDVEVKPESIEAWIELLG